MNLNILSKYIILFLFAVVIILSILFAISTAENKALHKALAVLKEQVELRDAAIKEIDKNIALLKHQVQMAENICEDRLKARNDVLNWVGNSEAVPHPNRPLLQGQVPQKCDSATLGYKNNKKYINVISDEKSNIAINYINDYWSMFTQSSDSKK